jgi:hypothetical protein
MSKLSGARVLILAKPFDALDLMEAFERVGAKGIGASTIADALAVVWENGVRAAVLDVRPASPQSRVPTL